MNVKNLTEVFSEALKNRLAKSTIVYTLSSFCNAATPFLLLPILTRYLSTDEYGAVSMFNATESLLLPFMGMSISAAVLRKLADGKEDEAKEYIFNALLVAAISSILISAVVLFMGEMISSVTALSIEYLKYVLIYTVATFLCDTTLGVFQIKEKVRNYAFFQNISTLMNLTLSIIFVVGLHLSLQGRIYGITFSKAIFALIGLYYIIRYHGITCRINPLYIKDVVCCYGFPLIPTVVKGTILTYTDKLFITNMLSLSDTGIYSVGNQFSQPIQILAHSFNLAFIPWLYKKLDENKEESKKQVVKLTYIYYCIALLIPLIWTGAARILIPFFTNNSYVGAGEYILYLSIGYGFSGMHLMVVNYIYYTKKTRIYALVTTSVLIINIVLNYFFIKANGAVGAAQATMIAEGISFLLTWILSAQVCKMPWFGRRKEQH